MNDYHVIENIGKGSFATVYSGTHRVGFSIYANSSLLPMLRIKNVWIRDQVVVVVERMSRPSPYMFSLPRRYGTS